MSRISHLVLRAIATAAIVVAATDMALANIEYYKTLKERGYATSKLTKNPRSGVLGWYVSGQGERYFCPKVGNAYRGGKSGAGTFTAGGYPNPMPAHEYEQIAAHAMGLPPLDQLPLLDDLLAGRPRPGKDARNCATTN
jgi:hypothetical protein